MWEGRGNAPIGLGAAQKATAASWLASAAGARPLVLAAGSPRSSAATLLAPTASTPPSPTAAPRSVHICPGLQGLPRGVTAGSGMRRAIASTLLRGLQAGGPSSSSSGLAVRAVSTQAPVTATLFPGDGKDGGHAGTRMRRTALGVTTAAAQCPPPGGGCAAALPWAQAGSVAGFGLCCVQSSGVAALLCAVLEAAASEL